jgi:gamma-glutamylcyclotransferase (GGCT)/AIG2-like uncharacterized protein YtfP
MQRRRPGSFEVQRQTGTHEVLDRLFVYGTLRQGQTARSLVANQIARCVTARTSGSIYVFPMGYPGFTENPAGVVHGELVWLNDLAATFGLLDAYEGTDFARVICRVDLEASQPSWAWIYTLADPSAASLGTLIEHGDWVRYWTEEVR